jgi:hypothetical protein
VRIKVDKITQFLIRSSLRNQHCCTKSAHFDKSLGPIKNIAERAATLTTHSVSQDSDCVCVCVSVFGGGRGVGRGRGRCFEERQPLLLYAPL